MKNRTKPSEEPLLREPKAKKLGLRVPKISMPHEDSIREEKLKLKIAQKTETSLTSQTGENLYSNPSQTSPTTLTRQTRLSTDIAPTRDFHKVANSVTKVIPEGVFVGKSKQLYDVLYSMTRGAIEPTRRVRISKSKLMKKSSIGSRITFDACVERLKNVGLIKYSVFIGEHGGNEFEVLLPEEIDTMTRQTSHTENRLTSLSSQTALTSSTQNPDRLVSLETSQTRHSLNEVNKTGYDSSNTSFKDNTKTDDEKTAIFSEFIEKFQTASRKLTGSELTCIEREKWGSLADLLILELEIAAKRTSSISSIPAFLTEVLRRKFFHQKPPAGKRSAALKKDIVGKTEGGEYEIKPLDEKGKAEALTQLMEFKDDYFLDDFKKWYTPEDWEWLIQELKKSDTNL